ncbi:membrane protein [Mycobacteroides franklinii]|nr:membrane protein [Mycobacteroides franklinii]
MALCIASVRATDWVNAVLFGVCSVVAVYLVWYENRQSQLENTQGARGRGPER